MISRLFDPSNYFLNYFALPHLVVALIIVALAGRLLFKEGVTRASVALVGLNSAVVVWFFFFFLMYCSSDKGIALFWAKASYAGVAFIPSTMYNASAVVLRPGIAGRRTVWAGWLLSCAGLLVIAGTDLVIKDMGLFPWGYYPRYSFWSLPYLLFFVGYIGMSLGLLRKGYAVADRGSVYSRRIKLFLLAGFVASLGLIDYLPKFGIGVPPYGCLAIGASVGILFRTITKYRLIDITPKLAAQGILDTMNEALLVFDPEGSIRLTNRAAEDLFGVPQQQLLERRVTELIDDAAFRDMGGRMRDGSIAQQEAAYLNSARGMLTLGLSLSRMTDEKGSLLALILIARDITEKKRAEEYLLRAREELELKVQERTAALSALNASLNAEVAERQRLQSQLLQSQKMEAVGTLAGGVAHDFNNILTAIIGTGHLIKMRMKPGEPAQALVDQILNSAERAAHLTHGLLAFSRRQVLNPVPVELNGIVRSVEKLLRRLIGEDVHLSTVLAEEEFVVVADAGQIEQVLMNLATNARDAMPEGGALTITTQAVEGDGDSAASGDGRPGGSARLSVSDTGAGMDERTREKIFEPFFTTKEVGRGTGLGLAIVYGIVKQHNGDISVSSESGKGTTITIDLPRVHVAVENVRREAAPLPRGRAETILLAEDDEAVREVVVTILTDYGYGVIQAVNGEDAIERFTSRAGEIDLVLLDVIMPHKNGREVCEVVRSKRPGIPVLFMSGYSDDILDKKGIFAESTQFVSKPINPRDLLQKVSKLLAP